MEPPISVHGQLLLATEYVSLIFLTLRATHSLQPSNASVSECAHRGSVPDALMLDIERLKFDYARL